MGLGGHPHRRPHLLRRLPRLRQLRLRERSGQITLALNQLVVEISEPVLDAQAVAVLDTAWILISGLPDIARSELVIRQMSRLLGKVVVVDELSLRKEEEVRVKVKCLDSSKLRTSVRVFFNDQGFDLRIAPEPPNHVGRPCFLDGGPPGDNPGAGGDYHGRHRSRSHRSDEEGASEDSRSHSPSPPSCRGGQGPPGRLSPPGGWPADL